MDFYDKIVIYKKTNKKTNSDLGSIIGMTPDQFRMATKRKSLSELEKREIENMFDIDHVYPNTSTGSENLFITKKVANRPGESSTSFKSDVNQINIDEEIEIFTNKNGVNFYLYPDDAIKIEVPIMPFGAYASSQIECYFDENYINKEFHKTQFNVDKIGKGVYMGFKTKNESMNGGGINDTPGGAEVLGREIGRQHWLSLHKNDYGFILMTKKAIFHKDIINYGKENGMFTLHSRNPNEKDFEVSINDVYRIFNVIKRTF